MSQITVEVTRTVTEHRRAVKCDGPQCEEQIVSSTRTELAVPDHWFVLVHLHPAGEDATWHFCGGACLAAWAKATAGE